MAARERLSVFAEVSLSRAQRFDKESKYAQMRSNLSQSIYTGLLCLICFDLFYFLHVVQYSDVYVFIDSFWGLCSAQEIIEPSAQKYNSKLLFLTS